MSRNRYDDLNRHFVPKARILNNCIKRQRLSDIFRDMSRDTGPIHADLLIEVLCRLPPKILMRCCCVSKGWYGLILFYCLPRITPSLPLLGFDVPIPTSPTNRVVVRALIPQDQPEADDEAGMPLNIDAWPNIIRPIWVKDFCNGLMLLRYKSNGRRYYFLLNPTTKRFVYCPIPYRDGAYVALAVDYEFKAFKIIAFPKADGAANPFMHVFYTYAANWAQRKVRYNNHLLLDKDAVTDLDQTRAYLHGRLFRLSGARLLLWYILEDDDVDVICDCVKLPDSDCLTGRRNHQLGCIGSSHGNLQYGQSDTILGLMKIWVFRIDNSQWILKHSIGLQALANHPQLVDLRATFPAVLLQAEFRPLAFAPASDAMVIWAPDRIFLYCCNSGKLVLLQIQNDTCNAVPSDKPFYAFPVLPSLVPSCVSYFPAKVFEESVAPFLPC